jgi:nucleoside-diphosphate-sugar epimerase
MLIKNLCNSNIKLNFGAIPYRKNEIMNSDANPEFLRNLGWFPKFSLDEGLRKTISYYQKHLVKNDE